MKRSLVVVVAFLVYTLLAPRLVALKVPCSMPVNGEVSDYSNCTLILASNTFLLFTLIGWVVAVIGLVLTTKTVKQLTIFAIILSVIIVTSYYAYIYSIQERVTGAPIYLDTVTPLDLN